MAGIRINFFIFYLYLRDLPELDLPDELLPLEEDDLLGLDDLTLELLLLGLEDLTLELLLELEEDLFTLGELLLRGAE